MSTAEMKKTNAASSRKVEANRRNAQLSTGPKTDEGKAKSSRNSITHGIFVKKFLEGATPETVAEIEELAAGLRDYYKPQGIVEEILVQKIVVETARYGRVLGLEQPEPGATRPYLLHCLDKVMRYTTSTSRALCRDIEELERVQAARKAREESAALMDAEPAKRPAELNEGNPRSRARTPLQATALLSKIRKMVSERMRPYRGWRGLTAPARAAKKSDFAKRAFCAPCRQGATNPGFCQFPFALSTVSGGEHVKYRFRQESFLCCGYGVIDNLDGTSCEVGSPRLEGDGDHTTLSAAADLVASVGLRAARHAVR